MFGSSSMFGQFKFDGPVENGYNKTSAKGSWLCGIQYVPSPVSPSDLMNHESLAHVCHMSPIFISVKNVCDNTERCLKRTLKSSYSRYLLPSLW